MKHIATCGIGLLLLIAPARITMAQNQAPSNSQSASSGQSLGAYARQVRKTPTTGQPKVFDNDNLPKSEKLSIVGKTTPPPAKNEEPGKAENAPGNSEAKPGEEAKPATGEK